MSRCVGNGDVCEFPVRSQCDLRDLTVFRQIFGRRRNTLRAHLWRDRDMKCANYRGWATVVNEDIGFCRKRAVALIGF